MKREKIEQYAKAIAAGNEAAKSASKAGDPKNHLDWDGGTCNIDTPVIDFKGWKEQEVAEVSKISGVKITDKMSSKMWRNHRFVYVQLDGQAANRTRMAEAAVKKMKEMGVDAAVYYQMD